MELSKKIKNQRGFTLPELLTSIFIISLLSVIFLANYRAGGSSSKLKMTAQKMASDIRVAQNNALGLQDFQSQNPLSGWGFFASKEDGKNNLYLIFADIDNNNYYSTNESSDRYNFKLANGVSIKDIKLVDANDIETSVNEMSIVYEPPDPDITICNIDKDRCGFTRAKIVLGGTDAKIKTVELNVLGLIDVE